MKENIRLSFLIRRVNDELRVLCSIKKFHFISNDNITRKCLFVDGVRITVAGINILVGNIVNYLNEVVLGLNWINVVKYPVKKYWIENVSDQKDDFHLANSNQIDTKDPVKMREVYSKNPILGYVSINSLRNKIVRLRDVVAKDPINILCIDETKCHSELLIENYQSPPFRRDRNSKRSGKIVYVRQGLISKHLKIFELKIIKTI